MEEEIYTFNLPDIGEGVVEGEVIEWLKQIGDVVHKDEPVVTVMTDKATVELPSPYSGKISKHYFKVGEVALKDKPLYDLVLDSGQNVENKFKEGTSKSTQLPAKKITKTNSTNEPVGNRNRGLAIPKVRKLASELGISLKDILGTGPNGQITLEDLRKARQPQLLSTIEMHLEGDEEVPLVGIRGLMAKNMAQSHAEVPQFSYFEQVDATRLIQLHQKFSEKASREGIKLGFMPFFIRALMLTAKKFPIINSSISVNKETTILHKHCNVGIAIASNKGLIVPVLKDLQDLSLEETIKHYETLKSKALNGKLTANEMKDATVTLSNFGALEGNGMWATPLINLPQVAILALAKIRKMPTVKNQEIAVCDCLPISWSFDHRVIDGELAAAISHCFSTLIRDPAHLL